MNQSNMDKMGIALSDLPLSFKITLLMKLHKMTMQEAKEYIK